MPVRPRSTSHVTQALTPIPEAGSLWARLKSPFARRRYRVEFERFKSFVQAFPTKQRRPLASGETQEMADDAVLLGLLDVDATFRTVDRSPSAYERVPGYGRSKPKFVFREWLVIHERRKASAPGTQAG
jgi:hypothetical protein